MSLILLSFCTVQDERKPLMQAVGTVSLIGAILFLPFVAAAYIYMPVSLGHCALASHAQASRQAQGILQLAWHACTVMSLINVSSACRP